MSVGMTQELVTKVLLAGAGGFGLAFLFVLGSPCAALAHTPEEELSVAWYLARSVMNSPEWVDNDRELANVAGETILYDGYDDLFRVEFPSNHVGRLWTVQERRAAFESFVNRIPELSTNGMCRGIELRANLALGYCREHGRTNVLDAAMRILSSKHSVAQVVALGVFRDFAVPSDRINAYAADMLTNETAMTADLRRYFLSAYASSLMKRRAECSPASFTNGVSLVVSSVDGWDGAIPLDRLLLSAYSSYEQSSNRLAVAQAALSDVRLNAIHWAPSIRRYFAPVTNRLLNAAQPLPEVEELRGLRRRDGR